MRKLENNSLKDMIRQSNQENIKITKESEQLNKKLDELLILNSQVQKMNEKKEKILEQFSKQQLSEIIAIIDIQESASCRLREQLKQNEREIQETSNNYQMQCRTLEQICEEFQGITIVNIAQKMARIEQGYTNYKTKYLQQDNPSLISEKLETTKFSNILEELNFSQIFES